MLSNSFSISCGLCYTQHFCKWAKQRQAASLLRKLHLGTKNHLHIYWEHTFLVYNSHHSGVGGGEAELVGRRSVTCYEALVREHPWEMNAGDNYGAGTKLVSRSPFTRCFKPVEGETVKQRRLRGQVFVAEDREIFQEATKFTGKKVIILSPPPWSCGDYGVMLTLINPHAPLFALPRRVGANCIQAESGEMHCRWSHDKWFYCPVMEIWIIIECLYSDACACYDSLGAFCQRTDELCCFYLNLPTHIQLSFSNWAAAFPFSVIISAFK